MNQDVLEKWKTLLASLTVDKESELICSETQILQVEKELGFKFPAGYPEYCRVFGSGSLDQKESPPNFFRIYCPCCPQSSFDIRQTGYALIGLKIDLDARGPIRDKEAEKKAYRLLENGYPFGSSDCGDSFMWDLTTYSDSDQSYDVYWVPPDERIEEITLVGRNFFEFVSEFCLGDKWKIMFQEEDFTGTPKTRESSFKAFEPRDGINSINQFYKGTLETFFDDLPSHADSEHVKISCGYDPPGKDQAECLQRAWGVEKGVEIEIVSPSERSNIPRLVEVKVTLSKEQMTRQHVDGLLRKMINIGEGCQCPPTSFGSET